MRKTKAKTTIGKTRRRKRAASPRLIVVSSAPAGRRRRGRPPKVSPSSLSPPNAAPANATESPDLIKSQASLDLTQKVKDLLRLANEQGHLTYDDVNNALPDDISTPADLDHVLAKLRSLEIEVIDAAEVERDQSAEAGEAGERAATTFWMIQCGCICARWVRCRC